MPCVEVFVQDPEVYLERFHPELACPVHPDRPAVMDAAHRASVNHETYFVSSAEALAEFRREPLRYCGIVTDPVSGARFRPDASSPRQDYLGRPYFFATAASRETFAADPAPYANAKRKMKTMERAPG